MLNVEIRHFAGNFNCFSQVTRRIRRPLTKGLPVSSSSIIPRCSSSKRWGLGIKNLGGFVVDDFRFRKRRNCTLRFCFLRCNFQQSCVLKNFCTVNSAFCRGGCQDIFDFQNESNRTNSKNLFILLLFESLLSNTADCGTQFGFSAKLSSRSDINRIYKIYLKKIPMLY